MQDAVRLLDWVGAQPEYASLLEILRQTLPGRSCLGAGCLTALVWNRLSERAVWHGVKDIDIATFDTSDLTEHGERQLESRLREACPDLSLPLDVKNQARVHLWYERKFGYGIAPHRSLEAAITTWPTTATAVAVVADVDGLRVVAPFGLDDLFAMIARPNRTLVTREVYEAKIGRWRSAWPEIRIEPW